MDRSETPTRSRNSHACDRCRARKRRCRYSLLQNGTNGPTLQQQRCDECHEFNVECTFLHPGVGRGIRRKRKRNVIARIGSIVTPLGAIHDDALAGAIGNYSPDDSVGEIWQSEHPEMMGKECRVQSIAIPTSTADTYDLRHLEHSENTVHDVSSFVIDDKPIAPAIIDTAWKGNAVESPDSDFVPMMMSDHQESRISSLTNPSARVIKASQTIPPTVEIISKEHKDSPWQSTILSKYLGSVGAYLPILDTQSSLSGLSSCCLSVAVQEAAVVAAKSPDTDNNSSSPRDKGVSNSENVATIVQGIALRYVRDANVASLTDEELRAALLLYLQTPCLESDPSIGETLQRLLTHIRARPEVNRPHDETSVNIVSMRSLSTCASIIAAWKHLETMHTFDQTKQRLQDSLIVPLPRNAETHHRGLARAFLCLSRTLINLLHLESQKIVSLDAEIQLLLWPASLPPEFSFVNRTLCSAESCLLHVLHNATATWYYTARLPSDSDVDGTTLLEPNDAVLSFLATLGNSCAKIWRERGKEFAQIWGHIFILAITFVIRQICLLVRRYDCRRSRGVLVLLLLEPDSHDLIMLGEDLLREVALTLGLSGIEDIWRKQALLNHGAYGPLYHQSDQEGIITYWMFRDLRNMMLRGLVKRKATDVVAD